jgi:RNA recognition motif-containing protein
MVKRNPKSESTNEAGRKRRKTTQDTNRSSFSGQASASANATTTTITRVFVGNLKYETEWQALEDHMRRAGNVDSVSSLLLV